MMLPKLIFNRCYCDPMVFSQFIHSFILLSTYGRAHRRYSSYHVHKCISFVNSLCKCLADAPTKGSFQRIHRKYTKRAFFFVSFYFYWLQYRNAFATHSPSWRMYNRCFPFLVRWVFIRYIVKQNIQPFFFLVYNFVLSRKCKDFLKKIAFSFFIEFHFKILISLCAVSLQSLLLRHVQYIGSLEMYRERERVCQSENNWTDMWPSRPLALSSSAWGLLHSVIFVQIKTFIVQLQVWQN